ncbi:MAG: hypothetical protein PSV35_01270, partial [bacterium]|nr:hypothetical protein [bacterium]
QLLLQREALIPLRFYCEQYTDLLYSIHTNAKKQEFWPDAQLSLDKLYLHFQNQLQDYKRYEPTQLQMINKLQQVVKDIGFEKSRLILLVGYKKTPPAQETDKAEEIASRLKNINLK